MTWNGLSILAVVPARGGSKGIPHKNLREVGGLSLVGWAARTVRELSWLDAAVLSSDDEAILAEGRRHGLEAPFLRPAELATDTADSAGVWRHAWLEAEAHFGRRFELSILLQPTTPLRRASDVERTVRAMVDGGHKAATTLSPVPGHFVPDKCVRLDDAGCVTFPFGGVSRRQDAPRYLHRNGACYAVTRPALVEDGQIVERDCAGVVLDGYHVNIDEELELDLAELLLERTREGSGES